MEGQSKKRLIEEKQKELEKLKEEYLEDMETTVFSGLQRNLPYDFQKIFDKVRDLFGKRMISIDLETIEHYNWIMTNRLQGGGNDTGNLFNVVFDHCSIVGVYNQSMKHEIYVFKNGKKNALCSPKALEHLLEETEGGVTFFLDIFLGFLRWTVKKFAMDMKDSPKEYISRYFIDDWWEELKY